MFIILSFIMHIHIISLFPELFDSFFSTSLLKKAQEKWILKISFCNPRQFCKDKHQQIDDEIYWWWAWMLIKAQPIIDAAESIIKNNKLKNSDFKIIFPSPAKEVFNQKHSYTFSKQDHLIFVCGRYEWIDYRRELYMQKHYPEQFTKVSLGQFILLWWEVATMTMIESICRLIPWVIKESESRQNESYSLKENMQFLEEPNYTRPEIVEWFSVPEILLTWNSEEIKNWRNENKIKI